MEPNLLEPPDPVRIPVRGAVRRTFGCLISLCGWLFVLEVIGLLAVGGSFEWWARRDQRAAGAAATVRLEVRKGDSVRVIAGRIERAGLAGPQTLLTALALRQRLDRSLQPGEYFFAPGTPPLAILRALTGGRPIATVQVTLPEGWTAGQIAHRLSAARVIPDEQAFLEHCGDPQFLRSAGILSLDAQGFLFPDTYQFVVPSDPGEVVRRLGLRFQQVLRELDVQPGMNSESAFPLNLRDTVTLASIIEREARVAEEMPLIASVYHNRLRKGMRLESCATVRYALDKWTAPLTKEDLQAGSAYNTYQHAGLPPGPICNPGRAALDAAFHPAASDFLFYVYKGDGHHAFSKTYQDHLAARAQYKDSWSLGGAEKTPQGGSVPGASVRSTTATRPGAAAGP